MGQKKIPLGSPLAEDLADFCEAHYGSPEINIIRKAVRKFIDERRDAEPEVKKGDYLVDKPKIKRHGLNYRDVAERLTKAGIPENERNLTNKISRGGFSAVFFLECLDAAGCKHVELGVS